MAMEQFEEIVGTQDETDEDKYMLARLYQATGSTEHQKLASRIMLDVVSSPDAAPQHLRAYIVQLLDSRRPAEARTWMQRLRRIAPESLENTVLRVRVLLELGDLEMAERVIANQIVDPDAADAATRNVVAAAQLVSLHNKLTVAGDDPDTATAKLSQAEALLGEPLVQKSELALELSLFLARRDRRGEALAHIERQASSVPDYQLARAAETLMLLLREPAQLERLSTVLSNVMGSQPDSVLLRLALADIQNWLGRYGEAETNYRMVLDRAPESVNALNNLAFLLAIQNRDLEEADMLNKKTLELMGPQPALLDSRALVLMAKRRYAEAEVKLEEAISAAPGNALYLMHQAEVQMALNRPDAAQTLKLAQEYGVADLPLHPSDRQRLQQLESQL